MSDGLPPPPPPGLNYIAVIRPSLNFILVNTPLGAALVPLVITLFYFSTPQTRRKPLFIFIILACFSGICEAGLNAALNIRQILFPLEPVPKSLLTAVIVFSIMSPVSVDSILLFRVLAWYPLRDTPRHTLVSILALPVLVKCGRFIAIVLYLNSFIHSSGRLSCVLLAEQWPRNPYMMIEWSLQILDNTYASSVFLYKLYCYQRPDNNRLMIRNKSFLSQLRTLFLIALGNFIFPVIMDIAVVVLITTNPSFTNGSYLLLCKSYVAILGVVFATIWTRRPNWNRSEGDDSESLSNSFGPKPDQRAVLSTLRFGPRRTNSNIDSEFRANTDTGIGRSEKQGV